MNLLYKIYFALPNFSGLGVVGRTINRALLRILKFLLDMHVPGYLKKTSLKETFKRICFFAKDLWLKVNTGLKGTKVVTTMEFNKDLVAVIKTQNERLVSQNSFGGGNDEQFQDVIKHFNFDAGRYYGHTS